jgi:hypothetical protein
VVVLSQVAIGGPGFNVDQVGSLGDIAPDNALIGLGSVANPMIADKMKDNASPAYFNVPVWSDLRSCPAPAIRRLRLQSTVISAKIRTETQAITSAERANFKISPDSYDAVYRPA